MINVQHIKREYMWSVGPLLCSLHAFEGFCVKMSLLSVNRAMI